jgi:hypothetical protein
MRKLVVGTFPSRAMLAMIAMLVILHSSSGCDNEDELMVARDAPREASGDVAPGLTQTIEVSSVVLRSGETISIRSVLTNASPDARPVSSRICGLTISGPMDLRRPGFACAGYSSHIELAPGDSIEEGDLVQVYASPGRYPLTIVHALDPPGELTIEIEIIE